MLKFVSKALGRKKTPVKKRRARKLPVPSSAPMMATVEAPSLTDEATDDEMSLEELEGMIVSAPQPEKPIEETVQPARQAPHPRSTRGPAAASPAPEKAVTSKPKAPPTPTPPAPATPTAPTARATNSPERDALIKNALKIQRSKQEVFAELSEEEREKLYVMAMKTLVDKNFGET